MKTLFFILLGILALQFSWAQEQDREICSRALNRALQSKNADSLATAYCHFGEYYAYRNSDSARYYFEQGLKHVRPSDVSLYGTLLINEAETYFSKGELTEALCKYQFARQEVERLRGDVALQLTILGSMGVIYRRSELPDSALVCYRQSLQLLESVDEPDEKIYVLTNMAILYANTHRAEEAAYYASEAMKLADRCLDMDLFMYACSTAGVIYSNQNKNEQAITCQKIVINRAQQEQKPRFVLKGMNALLGQYQKMNFPDSVECYLKRALQVVSVLPEMSAEVQGFRETQYQALTYLKRYRESLAVLQQLLQADEANIQVTRDELYHRMAKNYVALKEYAAAVDCYEKSRIQADSLRQVKLDKQLSEWTVKYQTQEKEMEIVRLRQQQLEQETRMWQGGIVGVVILFALLFVVIYVIARRRQEKKTEELKMAKSYIEGLERERGRLAKELHDGVCNDLLGVGMQLSVLPPDEDSKQEMLRLLECIRKEVRFISHELMPPQFQHLTLLETIAAYVERMPYKDDCQVLLYHEEDVEWSFLSDRISYETYRILQEWLSNVRKYAQTTRVEIWMTLRQEQFSLKVINDGKPFHLPKSSGNGIGLITIQERVKSLGGTLSIRFQEGHQYFELNIPVFA